MLTKITEGEGTMHDPMRQYAVLFVDDDPLLLSTIRRNLAKAYRLDTADSGREGLRLATERGPYAVVVTDLMMPAMDGIAFLREFGQVNPDAIPIVLTGHANLENALAAVNEGHVFRILTKPCTVEALHRAIDAGCEQFQLRRDQEELVALRRLGQAMEGIIYALTALVETRDPYTGGHQRRVASLAAAVAERMGLSADRIQGLRLAAMEDGSIRKGPLRKTALLLYGNILTAVRTHFITPYKFAGLYSETVRYIQQAVVNPEGLERDAVFRRKFQHLTMID